MDVLSHFDESINATFTLYRLKKGEFGNLLNKFSNDFRQCYITDDALDTLSAKIGISKSEYLEKYIIPDRPNIVSGDFGEILSYWALKHKYELDGILLEGIKKWQFKIDRNKAVMGADALLFHRVDKINPSTQDILVSIESKMKAVASTAHRIKDAVEGAELDKISRLGKTLIWIEELHAKNGDLDSMNYIKRFNDPATHGDYIKDITAVALLDDAFETEETTKAFDNNQNILVIVFSIEELKKLYENTRSNIISSV